MRRPVSNGILWIALLVVVVIGFFHESVLRRHSLVPADLLHQLMLPFGAEVETITVKNHFANDALVLDYPWAVFWQDSVRQGEVPLWNPYILGGHPHLAESMPAVVSPFKSLLLFLTVERAFTFGIVLEILLAALFMFAFLREIERSEIASFVGACAWAFNSGFLMWYWRAPNIFCWTPLILLLLERSVRRDAWRYALGAGAVTGLALLSGNIQAGAHLGFLVGGYSIAVIAGSEPARRKTILARCLFAGIVGVLLSAIQTLPAVELLYNDAYTSTQVRGSHASLRHTLLGPIFLFTFAFPTLNGTTESFDLLKLAGATRMEYLGYIGLVPFTMFVVGALVGRERRVQAGRWLIGAVFVIIFFTPLVKYLYHRFFVVAVFAMAYLAAYGTDALLELNPATTARIRRTLWGALAVCALVAVGLLLIQTILAVAGDQIIPQARQFVAQEAHKYAFRYRPEWFQQRVTAFFDHYRLAHVEFWLPLGSVALVAGAWFAYQRGKVPRLALGLLLAATTAADLTVLGRQWVPQTDLARYPLDPPSPIVDTLRADRDFFRIQHYGANDWNLLTPNWPMVDRFHDLWGNFSLSTESVERFPYETNGHFNALLDLANVKYILTDPMVALPTNRFELAGQTRGAHLYRNPRSLPHLLFLPQWKVVPDRAQLRQHLRAEDFDPRQLVFLETEPGLHAGAVPATHEPKLELERYTANRVVIRATVAQPGILLLTDTWDAGWKTTLDGQPVPLLRANWILRGVALPAGEHRVEMHYRPLSIRLGAWVSGLTAAGVILLSLRRR